MSVLHSKLPHKSSCTHTHRARHTVKGIIYSQNWKVWYSLACIGIVHTVNKPSHRLHVVTMFDLNAQPPHQTWDHFIKFVVQQAWNKTGGLVYRSSWQRSIPYRAWAACWRFLRLSKRTMFALSLYFVYLWFFFISSLLPYDLTCAHSLNQDRRSLSRRWEKKVLCSALECTLLRRLYLKWNILEIFDRKNVK